MKQVIREHYDRLVLALMLLAFSGSLIWSWGARTDIRKIRAQPTALRLPNSPFEPDANPPRPPAIELWSTPPPSPAGSEWVYELFTPPTVYFEPRTGLFAVTPPTDQPVAKRPTSLALVGTKREPFRVQFSGYFGEPGRYAVALRNLEKSQAWLVRAGETVGETGLRLKSFEVKHVSADPVLSGAEVEVAAFAVLVDEVSGTDITLDSRAVTLSSEAIAQVKIGDSASTPRDLREGDRLEAGGLGYRVKAVRLEPAEITLVGVRGEGAAGQTLTLRREATAHGKTADQMLNFPEPLSRPATGLGKNNP